MTVALIVLMALLVLILIGCPVFIALGLCGLIGFLIVGGISNITILPTLMYGQIDSFVLVAIPLYVLMGEVLASSGLAGRLYESLSKWLYKLPGGLGVASVYACAAFGAVCGVSIAGVAAIGPLAVPEMLKRGYDKRLATGSLAAAGALAILIPPSIVFIVYGSITMTSVAKLFIAGILPGVVLATMMAIYILGRVWFNPKLAPRADLKVTWRDRFRSLVGVAPVLSLAIFILVSLYWGICTPTELGAVGAVGAVFIGRLSHKSFSFQVFLKALFRSTQSTITVCIIIAAALCFGTFLNVVRVPEQFSNFCLSLPLPPIGVVILFMFLLIVLGCFIDGISIIVITTPILLPVILKLGFDPLWYGVLLALNLEMAVITPPVGLNLYMMKSLFPEIKLEDIIRGAFPFVIVEFICLLLFVFVPKLSFWLPSMMD